MHRNVTLRNESGHELATLRFTHRAFRILEERFELSPAAAIDAALTPTGLSNVVLAGMQGFRRYDDPSAGEVTPDEVDDVLDGIEHMRAHGQVVAAIERGWFDPDVPRPKADPPTPENPTDGDGASPKNSDAE